MNWIAIILIVISGVLITWQDFRQRTISWFLVPLLLIGISLSVFQQLIPLQYLYYVLINLIILAIMLASLFIYQWIKSKKPANFINKSIGLGDLLFFFALCFGFSPVNFVIFFLMGFILTLIIHLLVSATHKIHKPQIPLAGYLSVYFIIIAIAQFPLGVLNLFDDQLFLMFLL